MQEVSKSRGRNNEGGKGNMKGRRELRTVATSEGSNLDGSGEDMPVVGQASGERGAIVEDVLRLSLRTAILLVEGVQVLPQPARETLGRLVRTLE